LLECRCQTSCVLESKLCIREGDRVIQSKASALAHPGGRCTTTANTPGVDSSEAMGTVSTHRVNEPHRWTCKVKVRFTMSALHVLQAHMRIAYHLPTKLPGEPCGDEVCGHATSNNTSCAATISKETPAQPVPVVRYSIMQSAADLKLRSHAAMLVTATEHFENSQ